MDRISASEQAPTAPEYVSFDPEVFSNYLPPVVQWFIRMDECGRLPVYLSALRQGGMATTLKEAVAYTNDLVAAHGISEPTVFPTDLHGKQHFEPWSQLKRLLQERIPSEQSAELAKATLCGLHGTTSHYAVRDLLNGEIPSQRFFHDPDTFTIQTSIDGTKDAMLERIRNFLPQEDFENDILHGNRISDRLLLKIAACRERIYTLLHTPDEDALMYYTDHLYDLLYPIFGPYAVRLKSQKGQTAQQLLTPTFLNWANAVLMVHGSEPIGTHALFSEIPAYKGGRFKGGRIDAFEVVSIDGRPISKDQEAIIHKIATSAYPSVGEALKIISSLFGDNFVCKIWEFKYDIGDNKKARELPITREDIAHGPIPADRRQVEGYITLATLSDHITNDQSPDPKSWPSFSRFSQGGQILYWLHENPGPITFPIALSSDEQAEFFWREIVSRIGFAKSNATNRLMTNLLIGNVCAHLQGKTYHPSRKRQLTNKSTDNEQVALSVDTQQSNRSIEAFIESHRRFIDAGRVIEDRGVDNNGNAHLIMHADRLLEGLSTGTIAADRFSLQNGGFVHCMMPDHSEKTPSMHISFTKGTFHCFGCKAGGRIENFAPSGESFTLPILRRSRSPQTIHQGKEVEVPRDHQEIMRAVQEILQQGFLHSPGALYLQEKRKIDPSLALQLGTGYTSGSTLIEKLKRKGYTIEQLLHYGIASTYNDRIYSLLQGRVTFPLQCGDGIYTNFYGRAIGNVAKRQYHRKLPVEKTKIPHGLFNFDVLTQPYSEIIIVESCIDALTLIQLGFPNVVAIIGTENEYALHLIMQTGKDIAIGLDNDDSGQKITGRIREKMIKADYPAHVRNFTTEIFLPQFPDASVYDDFNSYFVNRVS